MAVASNDSIDAGFALRLGVVRSRVLASTYAAEFELINGQSLL